MLNEPTRHELADLGVLRVRGADATRFLQGQLSSDTERLATDVSQLAGYHNPQGRTIAVLRLAMLAADDLLAIVPRELAHPVQLRLAKYLLRAKVKLADESNLWRLEGLRASRDRQDLPASMNGQTRIGDTVVVRITDSPRWLLISPCEAASPLAAEAGDRETWRRLDIAAGLPQVYTATSEEFVAQMLNLDVLGAIAFDKGCYTGQEVIARAHYRGRVKRRLQRFVSTGPLRLGPGDTGRLADGRSLKVVEAAQRPDGRCEFLAVATLAAGDSDAAESGGTLDADTLPLPYEIPAA